MKIETGNKDATVSTIGRLPKQKAQTGAAAKAEKSADQDFVVTISDRTKTLAGAPADETGIRWDRVAAIREQLASGQYNISGKDVAAKILGVLDK